MERKVNVIEDIDGKKTVFIHDIIFKGKRSVKWEYIAHGMELFWRNGIMILTMCM